MAEASLVCYPRLEGRRTVLAMEGCLDLLTAAQGAECLRKHLDEHGPHVLVDTARLEFIDSKGVGALLAGAKLARERGGSVTLPHPALPVRKILEGCGLMALFSGAYPPPAEESADEAEAARPARARKTRAAA